MLPSPRSPAALPAPVAERLSRLAPDQRGAATTPPGPVLCVAPAGSGKTTTVVARLAWRVALGADPRQVCALTFNRRAAEELQERTDVALGEMGVEAGSVRIRTFHALGREILADAGVDVSRIESRQELLLELIGEAAEPGVVRQLDDAFTRLKLDPERGPPPEDTRTHAAFAAYQRRLAERGAIDLDDLVARAGPTLRSDARLLERWRARCRVLFVDEAQDLDRAQLDLAVLLAGAERDVFLVGDDDQTVYAWRLADVRRVLGLATQLPGLRRVDLETNHRCAPQIVSRAARLVAHNAERFDKRIRASPRAEGTLTLVPDSGDEVARARFLLSSWTARDGQRRAVLARTNRELAPYAAVALELGLAYRIEDDGLLLGDEGPIPALLPALERADAGAPVLLTVRAVAASLGLPPEPTAALLAWAAPYADLVSFTGVLRARVEARARLGSDEAPLSLATVHGTKGLEWDHVACIGFDEASFPSARSIRESDDPLRSLEEERRLAYVAWTRARRTLAVVYDPAAPSRFIREAFDPDELP